VKIRSILPGDLEQVRALLGANGWAHRVGDPDRFADLVSKSQRTAVAVVDERVVGFARALCDNQSNGYLSMLVVSPGHRRQGIGRALVDHIVGNDCRITWMLRADRAGAREFFAKLGFAASSVAMERTRKPPRITRSDSPGASPRKR